MGYRGHDLDLRTPQTWRAAAGDLAATGKTLNGPARGPEQAPGHEAPIWVDDTVLACFNHAFDVALAHRSAEVRIEHLLHALTRIEDAADILEASGIRTASLRRETATVIASEIPVSLTNGTATPRRSDGLEEVIRLAAQYAYQRNAPATVEDLLYVLLELRPAVRGVELIEAHRIGHRRERVERPLPVYRRAAPPAYMPPLDPRHYDPAPYEPRERYRRPAGRYFVGDAPPPPAAMAMPAEERLQAATDHLQNSRLDALEEMVRSIAADISGQRDDASRFSGGLFDRLQSLETMVTERPVGVTASEPVDLTPVIDRLAAFERRLGQIGAATVDVDTSKIDRRLDEIERQIAAQLAQSFDSFGKKVTALEASTGTADVMARLELIEEALLGRDGSASGDIDGRLTALSEAVSLQQTTVEDTRASLVADVRDVNATMHEQSARISRAAEGLVELVRAVESLRDEERNTLAEVGRLVGDHQSSVQSFVTQSNESLEVHNAELKEVHDALMKLNANQHTLAGSIDQWRNDGAGDLAIIASRIEALEREAGRPMALLETLSTNMENMHKLTVERYHRRNRFWYWLFGTDDWVAASWPSQSGRIEAERSALRQASGSR